MIEPVLHWNHIALEANRRDHTGQMNGVNQRGPTNSARALAMVHVAMYDTLALMVGVPRGPVLAHSFVHVTKYDRVTDDVVLGLSSAAREVLTNLYPAQASEFTRQFENILLGSAQHNDAVNLGKQVAANVINWRHDDLLNEQRPDPGDFYSKRSDIFRHKDDPFNSPQTLVGENFGRTRHFLLDPYSSNSRHYPMAGLEHLYEKHYQEHYEEVAREGAKASSSRGAANTIKGIFWAYDGVSDIGTPPRLFNQIAVQLLAARAVKQGPDLKARAVSLAYDLMLINCAMADAAVEAWHHKFALDLARPVVTIRQRGADSAGAEGDPFWEPLGAPNSNSAGGDFTPPFPAYPSGHATFGAAAFEMLRLIHGIDSDEPDTIGFDFVSDELNGFSRASNGAVRPYVKHRFNSLAEAMFDNGLSRVYLGVHWRLDATSADNVVDMLKACDQVGGIPLGRTIARKIFKKVGKLS